VFSPGGFLLASYNPLGFSNAFACNQYGQVTNSTDARGFGTTNVYSDSDGVLLSTSDALGNQTSYNYTDVGLLDFTTDPLSTVSQNTYDDAGNLVSSATLVNLVTGFPPVFTTTIFSTNSFAYDANGNRTKSVIWRTVGTNWVGATNIYILDAQNRVTQTIEPDGGTNRMVYDPAGRQQATIDKLGHVTSFVYDSQGRLFVTTNADLNPTSSAYDSNGNRTNSVDQLNRVTMYVYDALNRLSQTIFPDNTTNTTPGSNLTGLNAGPVFIGSSSSV